MIGDPADVPDVTFTITVTGPSYPGGHDLYFDLTDGVITPPQQLPNIIPGSYDITETPPAGWDLDSIITSPELVEPGDSCDTNIVEVTNSPQLGCLEIEKFVDVSALIGAKEHVPEVRLTITVTGPSYPTGYNLNFYLVYGIITPAQQLPNIIPGSYDITETPPAGWDLVSILPNPAIITPDMPYGEVIVIVTNAPQRGCLEIEKIVDLREVVGPIDQIPDVTFTITVTGASYPTGYDLYFDLIDGIISPSQQLSNIIPGSYTITETPPAGWNLDRIITSPEIVEPGD